MKNKVNIITTVSAWPEALEVQRALLTKFSRDDFNFIAVIDTSTEANPWNLWDTTLRMKAQDLARIHCDDVIMMPEEFHLNRILLFPKTKVGRAKYSNERAADTLQFVFQERIIESKTPCFIIDSDMFPIAPFSISERTERFPIRGVFQYRKGILNRIAKYYWNGILMFEPIKLDGLEKFSFDCGKINGLRVDTGGQSHWWIKEMEENGHSDKLGEIEHLSSLNWTIEDFQGTLPSNMMKFIQNDDRNIDDRIYSEIYDDAFLHFRAGSNWREESVSVVKSRNDKFLKSCL
jgi:hypothetical protein